MSQGAYWLAVLAVCVIVTAVLLDRDKDDLPMSLVASAAGWLALLVAATVAVGLIRALSWLLT